MLKKILESKLLADLHLTMINGLLSPSRWYTQRKYSLCKRKYHFAAGLRFDMIRSICKYAEKICTLQGSHFEPCQIGDQPNDDPHSLLAFAFTNCKFFAVMKSSRFVLLLQLTHFCYIYFNYQRTLNKHHQHFGYIRTREYLTNPENYYLLKGSSS